MTTADQADEQQQAERAGAVECLRSLDLFWQVRGRFYALAFMDADKDPRAARSVPGADELVALNPVLARGLWDRAMREVGNGLSRKVAIELSKLSATERLAWADAAIRTPLGFTPAAWKAFAWFLPFEQDGDCGGIWEWVATEGIATGLEHGAL